MKESNSNNADMSGKAHYPPPAGGVGGIIHTQHQQLPIKDELSRLQVQSLFEKNISHSVQNNTLYYGRPPEE